MKPNIILKWLGFVSKNTGARQNQTKENLPDHIYVVVDTTNMWVCGCFYKRDDAVSYTGGLDRYFVHEYTIK